MVLDSVQKPQRLKTPVELSPGWLLHACRIPAARCMRSLQISIKRLQPMLWSQIAM